jgi:hypothetical protein
MKKSCGMWWSAFGEAADTFPTASVAVRLKPVVPAVNRQHGVGSHTNLWLTPFTRRQHLPCSTRSSYGLIRLLGDCLCL